jgi:trigger factor
LPDLDDALAGEVADGKTLDELKADIRADLTKESDRRVEQEMDRQIQRELVARHDVSLPPSMISRYLAAGLEDMHKRNAQLGRPDSEEEDREYLEAGKPHAELALKAMLLFEAVRKKEEIKVTAEDVDERIEQLAADNGFDVDQYREFVNSGEDKDRIEYELLERRTYDFLLSRAEIDEVPADTDVLAEKE